MNTPRLTARLIADIYRVVGWKYAAYLCLMGLTGLTEAFSLASVVPLLTASGVGVQNQPTGGVGSLVMGLVAKLGLQPTTSTLALLVIAALFISTLLVLSQAYLGASLQTAYVLRWQQRLTSALFRSRWEHFQARRSGDLVNAIVTEAQRLGGAFYQAGLLLTGVVHGVLFLAVAALLSGATTAGVCAGGAVLFVATRPLIRRAYRVGTGISTENAELQSLTGELLSGAKLVKATATEDAAVGLIAGSADRLRRHLLDNAFDVQLVKGVFDFGAAAMAVALVVAGHAILRTDPAITLVVLAIFVRLMPKLAGVQFSLQSLALSLPAVELLQKVAAEAEAAAEPASNSPMPGTLASGPLALSLRGVAVRYGAVQAVAGVDLDVSAGSCVALVGGSGAGKSTLVDAILGLVPVTDGQISVNGVSLQTLPLASLRKRVGYMGQDTILYNGSIRDNLLWGRSGLADDDLAPAVRLAGADACIDKLPGGYDTAIGNGGALLSGGERQRLALARASLGAPGLLILDEATSALDAETERAVTEAVAALRASTTVILIAHRLSSARIADVICVMEDGRIVEMGAWDDLLQRRGRFHQLWQLQQTREQSTNVEA